MNYKAKQKLFWELKRAGYSDKFIEKNEDFSRKEIRAIKENKKLANFQRRKRRSNLKKFLEDYKVSRGCSSCPESDPRALQFHHSDPKIKDTTISKMLSNALSLEKILLEISKCEVVCANCHLKLHIDL